MAHDTDWRRHLPARTARRGWLHDHALTIVLVTLFLVSWVGQFIAQVLEVRDTAEEHGQAFSWSDFWPQSPDGDDETKAMLQELLDRTEPGKQDGGVRPA
ncbi:DUF6766 family protein [Actinokineospora sp. UTMC 2448]|uniref:DUF6766 family protein n=1 Tax=Actinokineospora sp. UTMC 2448 TaxID=2268449 RepID=UPI0021647B3A|nr:DUF6766 family protein [Actinokineospora sp. UTMC 2448]UVS79299.1 hypothetical protein Actkin_03046 [Actinokineospora sp. UTMC 2448]